MTQRCSGVNGLLVTRIERHATSVEPLHDGEFTMHCSEMYGLQVIFAQNIKCHAALMKPLNDIDINLGRFTFEWAACSDVNGLLAVVSSHVEWHAALVQPLHRGETTMLCSGVNGPFTFAWLIECQAVSVHVLKYIDIARHGSSDNRIIVPWRTKVTHPSQHFEAATACNSCAPH